MRFRALAGLALTLLLFALPAARAQEVRKLRIDKVRVGFQGRGERGVFKSGAWTPVYVHLSYVDTTPEQKSIGPADGDIVVETADSDEVPTRYSVRWPVLNANEETVVIAYTKTGYTNADITVTLRTARGEPLSTLKVSGYDTDAKSPGSVLYLVAGSRLPGLARALQPKPKPNQVEEPAANADEPAYIDNVEDLPTQWFGYDAVDVLVLTSGSETFIKGLLEDQGKRKEALAEWVRRGGRLVLSAGHNQQFVKSLLEKMPLLPCAFTGSTRLVDRLEEPRAWADEVVEQPLENITIAELGPIQAGQNVDVLPLDDAASRARPVLVQGPVGLGRVLLCTFDVDVPPFTTWANGAGQEQFWRRVGREMAPRNPSQQQNNGIVSWDDTFELESQLCNGLETFSEVPVVSFGWVALFILLYIIVIGPLDYLFLKYVLKRMEFAWITFPAIVLIVSGVSYLVAYYLKGNELKINKVDVVDIVAERDARGSAVHGAHVHGTSWFTLFSPRIQSYRVGIEPAAPGWSAAPDDQGPGGYSTVVSWLGKPESLPGGMGRTGSQALFQRVYDFAPSASGLTGVPIQVWATKSFSASWQAALAGKDGRELFSADLQAGPRREDSTIKGTIRNGLPVSLTGVSLLYRGQRYHVGELPPGKEVTVDLRGGLIASWFGESWMNSRGLGPPGAADRFQCLKSILFYREEGRAGNSGLRYLDQKWRTDRANEIVLVGSVAGREGPAETITDDGISPTRLWLGDLPGAGKSRPALAGTLSQNTYVRVFIPVQPQE